MVILLGIALQIDRKNLNRAEVKDVKNMAPSADCGTCRRRIVE